MWCWGAELHAVWGYGVSHCRSTDVGAGGPPVKEMWFLMDDDFRPPVSQHFVKRKQDGAKWGTY